MLAFCACTNNANKIIKDFTPAHAYYKFVELILNTFLTLAMPKFLKWNNSPYIFGTVHFHSRDIKILEVDQPTV